MFAEASVSDAPTGSLICDRHTTSTRRYALLQIRIKLMLQVLLPRFVVRSLNRPQSIAMFEAHYDPSKNYSTRFMVLGNVQSVANEHCLLC